MKSRIILTAISIFFLTTSISFGYKATFSPRISVRGEYTDNILLTENKDLKEDDVITTISPGFTAELIGKKAKAMISYDPAYAFYDKFNEFNGWRHLANLSGGYAMTKHTRFDIKDNFLYTEDPIRNENIALIRTENPEIPIDSTQIKSREIFWQNVAVVGLSHRFGEYHSFRLGYTNHVLNYNDPAIEDKQSHTPSVDLEYWFGPKWGFDVSGRYTRGEFDFSDNVDIYQGAVSLNRRFGKHFVGFIRYDHSIVNHQGESEDDVTYSPTIGIKYDIKKDMSLRARIGYFYNDFEFRENQSNASGDLRFIKRYEHGQMNLALLGGYDYSYFDSENLGFNVYVEGSVSISHQLGKHFYGNLFGSYRNSEYKDASDRRDKIPTVGIGLVWQALEWMSIGVNYRYRSIDSTLNTVEYEENRGGVWVTLTPKQPFRTSRY